MKRSFLLLFASTLIWAQSSAPASQPGQPKQAPPSQSAAPAPSAAPAQPKGPVAVARQDPKRVVAVINGQNITAEQALRELQALPQNELQQFQRSGGGLTSALQQIYLMRHLSDLATQQHLDQQEPWKSQLEFAHSNMLAQAYVNEISSKINPSAEEIKSYYDQHPQDFQEAKLSAIIVNFTPPGTTAPPNMPGARTEAQAKTKADDLVKKIRGGANFETLAKSDSDHKASAEKGGELGVFTPDRLPKEISDPVFKLKAGDITDPIREASGYYILKVDSIDKKTFEKAQSEIVAQLKSDQVRKTIDQQSEQYKVQVQDSDFFNVPGTRSTNTPSLAHPTPGQTRSTSVK
jgi:peptidyl-prolyl cis-trans isomerase C